MKSTIRHQDEFTSTYLIFYLHDYGLIYILCESPQLTYNGNASDIQPLKTALDALSVDANQGTSNLLSGMMTANNTFSSGAIANALKIMVLITDGQFADTTVIPTLNPVLTSLVSQKVLTLLYSFDRSQPAMAALSQIACSMNGTYERIEKTVMNPLWTMRSYFGIIAHWRLKAVNFKPYWSKPYNDSGGLSQVITVAYPAFAPDNYTLIGVVGSDVLMTELGNFDTTGFSSALLGRATDDPLTVTFKPLTCNVNAEFNSYIGFNAISTTENVITQFFTRLSSIEVGQYAD